MLVIDEFIWLPEITEKLAVKHQVSPEEVEEVFFNRSRYRFHEKGRVRGEDMYTLWDRAMKDAILSSFSS